MIAGVGTDILKIERLAALKAAGETVFLDAVYTAKEQQQALDRPDPLAYYASRFAAKEAVFKCLGLDGNRHRLNEIEVLASEGAAPQVNLRGSVREVADARGIGRVDVSLSYEDIYVVAFAVAFATAQTTLPRNPSGGQHE